LENIGSAGLRWARFLLIFSSCRKGMLSPSNTVLAVQMIHDMLFSKQIGERLQGVPGPFLFLER
jgi:hypothetical protein